MSTITGLKLIPSPTDGDKSIKYKFDKERKDVKQYITKITKSNHSNIEKAELLSEANTRLKSIEDRRQSALTQKF
jgi:hypothetical protein